MPPQQTMQALLQTAYGESSKSLAVTRVPLPAFSEDSDRLLLKVKAVSINPLDYMFVKGNLRIVFNDKPPMGVGCDVSGVVVKAGKGTGFQEGDEVFGGLNMAERGSIAEYCTVRASNCALKPAALSHEEAACIPIAGLTAIQALQRHQGPKEVAFIPAGLGGVGSLALQLAKPYAGFKKTITTVSTAKVQLVKEHVKDVDQVIDYKTTDPASVIPAGSCDFVLDQFGKPAQYVRYMRKPAATAKEPDKPSIISILAPPKPKQAEESWGIKGSLMIHMVLSIMDWLTRLGIPGWVHYDSFGALMVAEDLKVLARLAEEGKLKPVIYKVLPLEEAVEAIVLAETKPAGKVVVRIGD